MAGIRATEVGSNRATLNRPARPASRRRSALVRSVRAGVGTSGVLLLGRTRHVARPLAVAMQIATTRRSDE
jgi:hypothetical protein